MRPIKIDLSIDQGGEYVQSFVWKVDGVPVDLTGYGHSSQIREYTGGELLLDLDNYITLNADDTDGRILINIPSTDTGQLKSGVWDLFIFEDNDPTNAVRLLAGDVTVYRRVSFDE